MEQDQAQPAARTSPALIRNSKGLLTVRHVPANSGCITGLAYNRGFVRIIR